MHNEPVVDRPRNGLGLLAATAAALVLGIGIGSVGTWALQSPAPAVEREVTRELTDAEMEAIWQPRVAEAAKSIEEAHTRISTLEADVASRETKIQELEAEMARRKEGGVALKKQLDTARAELATVKEQLAQALADKERLTAELQQSRVELADQKARAEKAETNEMEQKWTTFLAQARLEICEKGGRNKMENCRESVLAALDSKVHDQFLHCLRAGQEAPSVHEASKDLKDLPRFAAWLNQDEKATRDWYLQACDPTLPEAGATATATATPAAPTPTATTNVVEP